MSPEQQRPADEDEIKKAEREDTPETTERQRPATEEEIQEAEKESKDEAPTTFSIGKQRGASVEKAARDIPASGPVAEQRVASEDEIEAAERKAER